MLISGWGLARGLRIVSNKFPEEANGAGQESML